MRIVNKLPFEKVFVIFILFFENLKSNVLTRFWFVNTFY